MTVDSSSLECLTHCKQSFALYLPSESFDIFLLYVLNLYHDLTPASN